MTNISLYSQITDGINITQIEDLMRYTDYKGNGIKCHVICPIEACRKKTVCIHKKYVRGRKRRNGESNMKIENDSLMYRKATWYFSNFQTHLEHHQAQVEPENEGSSVSLGGSFNSENVIDEGYELITTEPPGSRSKENSDHSSLDDENIPTMHKSRAHTSNMIMNHPLPVSPLHEVSLQTTSQTMKKDASAAKLQLISTRTEKDSSVKNLIEIFSK